MKVTRNQIRALIKEALNEDVAHPTLWLGVVLSDIKKTMMLSPEVSKNPEYTEKLAAAMDLIIEVLEALREERSAPYRLPGER